MYPRTVGFLIGIKKEKEKKRTARIITKQGECYQHPHIYTHIFRLLKTKGKKNSKLPEKGNILPSQQIKTLDPEFYTQQNHFTKTRLK